MAIQIEGNGATRMVVAHMAIQIFTRTRPLPRDCLRTICIRLVAFTHVAAGCIDMRSFNEVTFKGLIVVLRFPWHFPV